MTKLEVRMVIFVELLNEGTQVWRPVEAEHLGDDLFRITQVNTEPDLESWQFETGATVRCRSKVAQDGENVLVAFEKIQV